MAKRKSNSINRKRNRESKKIESVNNFDGDILSKVGVCLGVVVFLFAFYLLTLHITNKNKEKENKDEKEEVTVSNENIMVGRALSMSDGDYIVVFYDKGDEEINANFSSMISSYKYSGRNKIYSVDMSNGFNKKFLTTGESNKTPASADDFQINGPTLILVSNHSVVDYVEGEDAIKEYLS